MLNDIVYAMAGGAENARNAGPQEVGNIFSAFYTLTPFILIFIIFYFLLIRPQSKKAKEHKEMLESLKKGDKIITTGGIYGVIEDINGNTITLKIGVKDDVRIKINRNYIADKRRGD